MQILALSVEAVLSPKTEWLRGYLRLSTRGVVAIIKACPDVLGSSIEYLEGKVRMVMAMMMKVVDADVRSLPRYGYPDNPAS